VAPPPAFRRDIRAHIRRPAFFNVALQSRAFVHRGSYGARTFETPLEEAAFKTAGHKEG